MQYIGSSLLREQYFLVCPAQSSSGFFRDIGIFFVSSVHLRIGNSFWGVLPAPPSHQSTTLNFFSRVNYTASVFWSIVPKTCKDLLEQNYLSPVWEYVE